VSTAPATPAPAVLEYFTAPRRIPIAHTIRVWREGSSLWMDRNALLPQRCICCGGQCDGRRTTIAIAWTPLGLHYPNNALALPLAILLRRVALLHVCLCREHRRHVIKMLRLAFLLLILTSELVWLGLWLREDVLWALSSSTGIISGLVALRAFRIGTPGHLDRQLLRLDHVAAGFLNHLPIGGPPGIGQMPATIADRLEHLEEPEEDLDADDVPYDEPAPPEEMSNQTADAPI
jgi:hypothetical protein